MNLLVVDDELHIIQGILNGVRFELLDFEEVLTAKSYNQAIEVFRLNRVDVLLSDIEMADQNGLDLIEWVNRNYPETESIILSCHDEFSFARRAVGLNCLDYVLKPVPYELLTEVLLRATEKVRKERSHSLHESNGKIHMKPLCKTITEGQEDIIDSITTYIKNHIAENILVESLAKMTHISPRHLNRLFQKQFNQSISEYIIKQRMIVAGKLLKEKRMSVTMVSDNVGYGNYSYFIKQFKKFYGMTPREYQLK